MALKRETEDKFRKRLDNNRPTFHNDVYTTFISLENLWGDNDALTVLKSIIEDLFTYNGGYWHEKSHVIQQEMPKGTAIQHPPNPVNYVKGASPRIDNRSPKQNSDGQSIELD